MSLEKYPGILRYTLIKKWGKNPDSDALDAHVLEWARRCPSVYHTKLRAVDNWLLSLTLDQMHQLMCDDRAALKKAPYGATQFLIDLHYKIEEFEAWPL